MNLEVILVPDSPSAEPLPPLGLVEVDFAVLKEELLSNVFNHKVMSTVVILALWHEVV